MIIFHNTAAVLCKAKGSILLQFSGCSLGNFQNKLQKTVSTYLKSKKILLFAFARENNLSIYPALVQF